MGDQIVVPLTAPITPDGGAGASGAGAGIKPGLVPAAEKPIGNNAPAGGQQAEPDKTFTQQELERIVQERLARERTKFADYDAVKAQAEKWKKYEEAQKTEGQKTQERIAALERERDVALARANDRLILAAFVGEAARAGALHPEDVFALADISKISVDEAGNVLGVTEAVQAVVSAGRVPLATTKPLPPKLDGGAGSGNRPAEKPAALTEEELKVAQFLHIPAEKYLARRDELRKARRQE